MLKNNYKKMNEEIYRRLTDTLINDLYADKVLDQIEDMVYHMTAFRFITTEQHCKLQKIIEMKKNIWK